MDHYNRYRQRRRDDNPFDSLAENGRPGYYRPNTPNRRRSCFHGDCYLRQLAMVKSGLVVTVSVIGSLGVRVAVLLSDHWDRKDSRTNWTEKWAAYTGDRGGTGKITHSPRSKSLTWWRGSRHRYPTRHDRTAQGTREAWQYHESNCHSR